MIKERYVNFEVARLLKDKGFNEPFYFFYRTDDKAIHHVVRESPLIYCNKIDDEVISAPTQQMACDWVRTKEVLITYDLASLGAKGIMAKVYKRVYDDPNYDWTEVITLIGDTLEEAINAVLKFALEYNIK